MYMVNGICNDHKKMHFIDSMFVKNLSIAPRCSDAVAAEGLACFGVRQLLTMLIWMSKYLT